MRSSYLESTFIESTTFISPDKSTYCFSLSGFQLTFNKRVYRNKCMVTVTGMPTDFLLCLFNVVLTPVRVITWITITGIV